MSMYGFLGSASNPNDIIHVDIPQELLVKTSGESVKSAVISQLQSLQLHNVVSTKQGLRIKHSVMVPVGQLRELIDGLCRCILKLRDGQSESGDIENMVKDIARSQIKRNFLIPEKLAAFGMDSMIARGSESASSDKLLKQLQTIAEGKEIKDNDGGMSYWRYCCAKLSLRELEVLIAISG